MTQPIQAQNRGEMRRTIGRRLNMVIVGAATSTTDTTSLIDTTNLWQGDDEHNDCQVMIYDASGSIADGETKRVTDFANATSDATTTAFSAAVTSGDKYELWKTPWLIADINDVINQAIMEVSDDCLQSKQTESQFTKDDTYLYNCLSGFKAVSKVEYEADIGEEVEIDDCDSAWTAGTNATVTADSSVYIQGSASNKIVVAAGAGATEVLAYNSISSIDISACDKLEISIYSTIALTAGQLQVRLDDTALGASVVESLDIPATSANTWTRHIISLANPLSDTAIIYVDIYQVADVGACTLYIDYIRAVNSYTRIYKELNPEHWRISRASTPLLELTPKGLEICGDNQLLRISGYELPDLLSDDSTDSEIDPAFIIAYATGHLLISHAKSPSIDIQNKQSLAQFWLAKAEAMKPQIRTNLDFDTRLI